MGRPPRGSWAVQPGSDRFHERGLIEARQESERVHELGNDRPMVSPQLVVEGITTAGRAFVNDQCG